jgi:outer membrane protein assembly factor BamD
MRIAKRHFYIGRFYHKTGEYKAAIPRFQEILTNYTGLGLDEKSLYLMGESYERIKEKERALEILSVFEQHFPESRYRKKLASKLDVK